MIGPLDSTQQQNAWRMTMARHTGWLALAIAPLLLTPALAQSQKVGDPPEASNMRLVGMNDLQARSAYQPTIHRQGDRYIAYIGHHGGTPDVPKPMNKLTGQAEFNGTSILDVTDPANPKYLTHPRARRKLRGRRRADGARVRRRHPAECRQVEDLHAARVRRKGARDLGRKRRDKPQAAGAAGKRARHAQELVGMRHRHCISRLRHCG